MFAVTGSTILFEVRVLSHEALSSSLNRENVHASFLGKCSTLSNASNIDISSRDSSLGLVFPAS
jgi:hypothetical protein